MLPLTVAGAEVLSPSADPEQKFRTDYLLRRSLEIYDVEDKLDRQVGGAGHDERMLPLCVIVGAFQDKSTNA